MSIIKITTTTTSWILLEILMRTIVNKKEVSTSSRKMIIIILLLRILAPPHSRLGVAITVGQIPSPPGLKMAYCCIAASIYIHTMAWKVYRSARLAIRTP
jgi:hypothetical protein